MNVTIKGEAPVSAGVSPTYPGHALGFSNRAVVESTAEVVGDMLGHDSGRALVMRRGVPDELMYWVRENASYRVRLSGGAIRLQVKHPRPHDVTDEPEWRDTRGTVGAQRVQDLWVDDDAEPVEVFRRGMITHWSKRSRRNMIYALATLDHDTWTEPDWRLSMVTLTLPGDWLAAAPDGRIWKRSFKRFTDRWRDQFGWWECAWKQEFQDRGAPHMHIMTRVPNDDWRSKCVCRPEHESECKCKRRSFRSWLSWAWAECVDADDTLCHACGSDDPALCDCPVRDTERARHQLAGTNVDFGFRGTDPKRIAVYFLKHSSKTADGKEYQHQVPMEWQDADQGPGRFWGIAGLGRLDVLIEVDRWAWDVLKRALRHWHRAQRSREALARRSHAIHDVSEATRRATLNDLRGFGWCRDRVLTDPFGGGWVLVNDAPALLYAFAAWLAGQGRAGPVPGP